MINILNKIKNNNYELYIKENYIHIINYKEVIDLKDKEIYIKLNNINIKIKGNNLIINSLDEEELLIKGNIKEINFISE